MRFRSLTEVEKLYGKKVVVRLDLNVPIKNGKVADDFKLERSLPTIEYLRRHGAKIILVSHLGRPTGVSARFSLKPLQRYLERVLGSKIELVSLSAKPAWASLQQKARELKHGQIMLLENIRFVAGEEDDSPAVAKGLAGLGDLFVLDGFGVAHRAAASVSGVAKHLPTYAGLLLSEEINVLTKAIAKPKKPLVVVLGGAKAETKIPAMKHLLAKANYILLGGGLVNTYLLAKGHGIGASLVDKAQAKEILKYCANKKVILPIDVVIGSAKGKQAYIAPLNTKLTLPKTVGIYDIGPASVQLFSKYIKQASTVIWNGAMGRFEQFPYGYGTKAIACLVAARAKGRSVGIIGGGETVEVVRHLGLTHDIDLVSTGGGALLEFLSGKKLPGVTAVHY